jgi:hypothetical protein
LEALEQAQALVVVETVLLPLLLAPQYLGLVVEEEV